jgi:glutaminyl-peptide cyclotransferase
MFFKMYFGLCFFLSLVWGAVSHAKVQRSFKVEVLNEYEHDSSAFTQGLFFVGADLFESTGLNGESSLRQVDLESGEIINYISLDEKFFGEGACYFDNKIFQLTWKAKKAFVYDATSLEKIESFVLKGEGWGLSSNSEEIVLSDGSSVLHLIDPVSKRYKREIFVKNGMEKVERLNELEWVGDYILANIWQTDRIVVIEKETGKVIEVWDLSGVKELIPEYERSGMDVLNGIAWKSKEKRLFVTGKKWPRLFEIKVPESIIWEN